MRDFQIYLARENTRCQPASKVRARVCLWAGKTHAHESGHRHNSCPFRTHRTKHPPKWPGSAAWFHAHACVRTRVFAFLAFQNFRLCPCGFLSFFLRTSRKSGGSCAAAIYNSLPYDTIRHWSCRFYEQTLPMAGISHSSWFANFGNPFETNMRRKRHDKTKFCL